MGRIAGWAASAALFATAGVLAIAGATKNAQITELRQHGVHVEVTVTSCRGLLGGSGSNVAGYTCTGSYVLDGARRTATLPGSTLLTAGARVVEVAATTDPGLLSSVSLVRSERPSPRVFLVPAGCFVAGVLLGAELWRRGRASRRAGAEAFP